jgi:hypothetical protein
MHDTDDWAIQSDNDLAPHRQEAAGRLIVILNDLMQRGGMPAAQWSEARHLSNLVLGKQRW